jgi:hypothetical protein
VNVFGEIASGVACAAQKSAKRALLIRSTMPSDAPRPPTIRTAGFSPAAVAGWLPTLSAMTEPAQREQMQAEEEATCAGSVVLCDFCKKVCGCGRVSVVQHGAEDGLLIALRLPPHEAWTGEPRYSCRQAQTAGTGLGCNCRGGRACAADGRGEFQRAQSAGSGSE